VEIITAKGEQAASGAAGPSRDWLSPGYTVSNRTRSKIRAWFNAIEHEQTLAARPQRGGKNLAARRQDSGQSG
jgi:GTP pyrophosphokinase